MRNTSHQWQPFFCSACSRLQRPCAQGDWANLSPAPVHAPAAAPPRAVTLEVVDDVVDIGKFVHACDLAAGGSGCRSPRPRAPAPTVTVRLRAGATSPAVSCAWTSFSPGRPDERCRLGVEGRSTCPLARGRHRHRRRPLDLLLFRPVAGWILG